MTLEGTGKTGTAWRGTFAAIAGWRWTRPLSHLLLIATATAYLAIYDGRIRVGTENHAGIVPVARRILDPNYLPGDFGIKLREFHHRSYAWMIAGASRFFGETNGLAFLHVLGLAFVSAGVWALLRALGLPACLYGLVIWAILAQRWHIGQGAEVNDIVEIGKPVMPPTYAHGLILALLGMLIQKRWRLAALITGMITFLHVQLGLVTVACTGVFYFEAIARRGVREIVPLAVLFLVPAAPSLWFLGRMLQKGIGTGMGEIAYLEFRQRHHFAFKPPAVTATAIHAGLLLAVWGILRWRVAGLSRGLGVLALFTLIISALSALHYLDFHIWKIGMITRFQFIRVTCLVTVLSLVAVLAAYHRLAHSLAVRFLRPAAWRVGAILNTFLVIVFLVAVYVHGRENRKRIGLKVATEVDRPWNNTCRWIRENTPANVLFLTPPGMPGFTYLSHRSTIVDFKNNPDGGMFLDEWIQRLKDVTGGAIMDESGQRRLTWDGMDEAQARLIAPEIMRVRDKYGARYWIARRPARRDFAVVFENQEFVVMDLLRPQAETQNSGGP